jgi:hypothetical protein
MNRGHKLLIRNNNRRLGFWAQKPLPSGLCRPRASLCPGTPPGRPVVRTHRAVCPDLSPACAFRPSAEGLVQCEPWSARPALLGKDFACGVAAI